MQIVSFRQSVKKLIKYYDDIYQIIRLITKPFSFILFMNAVGTLVEALFTLFFLIARYDNTEITVESNTGYAPTVLNWSLACILDTTVAALIIKFVKKEVVNLEELVYVKFKNTEYESEKIEVHS